MPSVTSWYRSKTRWNKDFGFLPYNSLDLVFCDKNFMPSNEWVLTNETAKEGHPLKRRYFAAINSSSVKMIADRHRHAAYHNKHCCCTCWYQHLWLWMTIMPQNKGFSDFFAIFGCRKVNCREMDGDRSIQPGNRNCYRFSRVSCALARISCLYSDSLRLCVMIIVMTLYVTREGTIHRVSLRSTPSIGHWSTWLLSSLVFIIIRSSSSNSSNIWDTHFIVVFITGDIIINICRWASAV